MTRKIYHRDNFFLSPSIFFNNTLKVALEYLFNVVMLLSTDFNLKLCFEVKKDPKLCNFKNLKEIFQKKVGIPGFILDEIAIFRFKGQ